MKKKSFTVTRGVHVAGRPTIVGLAFKVEGDLLQLAVADQEWANNCGPKCQLTSVCRAGPTFVGLVVERSGRLSTRQCLKESSG